MQQTTTDAKETAQYLAASVELLRNQMLRMHENGSNRGYSRCYQALGVVGRDQATTFANREANRLKNRYANISPYDHSRVVLPIVNADPDSDYINANWVNGYRKESQYIASQVCLEGNTCTCIHTHTLTYTHAC